MSQFERKTFRSGPQVQTPQQLVFFGWLRTAVGLVVGFSNWDLAIAGMLKLLAVKTHVGSLAVNFGRFGQVLCGGGGTPID
eukprot:6384373-Amphidinium_carterae.1